MPVLRIAILLNTTGSAGREILRGVGAHARANPLWYCQFRMTETDQIDPLLHWKPDGVIVELYDPRWVAPLRKLAVPVIDVSKSLNDAPFPVVGLDDAAIGSLAADHLLDRGLRRFAFIGLLGAEYARRRQLAFEARIAERGGTCTSFNVDLRRKRRRIGWNAQDESLRDFIRSLPYPPLGVFASNDGRAIQFIEAGRELGLDVPGQVAVLGCDDDDLLCDLARPPLSSIAIGAERIGHRAAAALDDLLAGKPVPPATLFPPLHVVTRRSTETLAVSDPDLSTALRFIEQNAHRPIRGDEVVGEVAVARRALERRFIGQLNRTLHDEITAAHQRLAVRLLAGSDLPIPEIAHRSGFGSVRAMHLTFHKKLGLSPAAYRRRVRPR